MIHTKTRQTESDGAVAAQPVSSASVLDLVLQRVRLMARRRAAWLAHLSDSARAESETMLSPDLEASLDGRDTSEGETLWFECAEIMQPLNEELGEIERRLAGEAGARLSQLASLFRLSQAELDLLQTCLALAIDPTLGMVYAHLQRHPARTYATGPFAARLFGYGYRSSWNPGCPLAVWRLVVAGEALPGESGPLAVDPLVVDWLQGELRMDPALVGLVQLVKPRKPFESWPVEATVLWIERGIQRELPMRILLAGPPLSGRRTFAAGIAARFGIQVLGVDTSEIPDGDWPNIYMRAQRLAVMGGMALVWHGSHLHRSWPGNVSPVLIQFVACEAEQVVTPCQYTIDHRIDLPAPTLGERRGLWKANIPESKAWSGNEFETLIGRYRLNAGDIVSVARRAPASAREAAIFVRELTRHRLGALGRVLDCPFTWEDLVVPDKLRGALEDFAFEARDRTTFWESPNARRLFPRGTGLVGLFSGLPGTGKTMASQVIAAELELDLFRIDLATVVSKYIGETAKHLCQIFTRAARMNAVLLFDEADALFSKRTEVKDSHDRYANADTSYLLQLLEEYPGIVILASNKKQNIDPAFIRRVRYMFDFPRPEIAGQRQIWRQVIGELSGDEPLTRHDKTIEVLAANVELSGAQIKTAVLAAIFVARRSREPLAMPHFLRGLESELGKEGRVLGARERERLMRDG